MGLSRSMSLRQLDSPQQQELPRLELELQPQPPSPSPVPRACPPQPCPLQLCQPRQLSQLLSLQRSLSAQLPCFPSQQSSLSSRSSRLPSPVCARAWSDGQNGRRHRMRRLRRQRVESNSLQLSPMQAQSALRLPCCCLACESIVSVWALVRSSGEEGRARMRMGN